MGGDDDAALKSERLAEGQLKKADCLWITDSREAVVEDDLLEFHTPSVSLVSKHERDASVPEMCLRIYLRDGGSLGLSRMRP